MKINEMFVRVGADTTDLQRGMRDAENRVRSFGRATSSINFDRLRGPLTTLTGQITGLSPALGTLAGTLLSMGAGGGVAVAAIGGFAAIGAAIRSMTEDTKEADKALVDTAKRLDEMARKRAVGGQLTASDDAVAIRTKLRELRDQAAPLAESVSARESMGALGQLFGTLADERARLESLNIEIATWERRLKNAERAMLDGIPAIEGITVSIERLKQKALTDFGGTGLNATAEAARAAVQGGGSTEPPWLRKLTESFDAAVEDFGAGVKEMVTSVFSREGLANIGQGLAQQGIGFLAGKAIEKVGTLFTTGAEKIAAAMEQNTRAQRATAEFLSERLTGSELTDEAQAIARVLQDTINEIAVGGPNEILGIFAALKKAGISLETFHAVAERLGIDSKAISLETLQQFLDQINKAGAGVDSLADATERATEALNNVPEIWNAALGRFRSTRTAAGNLVPAGGGNTFTGNIVLPSVRNAQQFYDEMGREATRRTARGGAPVIIDSNQRPRQ
jgi:hypothetical protein